MTGTGYSLFPARRVSTFWCQAKDGDAAVRAVFDRHYSRQRYRDGRNPKLFVGPGEKIVLVTPEEDAIFFWRKFIDDCVDVRTGERQAGVNCAAFRNESRHLSSLMIQDAMGVAWRRWPGARLYTYVDPRRVHSANPGYCFKQAGWRRCGCSKGGMLVLEVLPGWVDLATLGEQRNP